MSEKLNRIISQCKIYKEGKYDRHPNKFNISPTPVPQYAGKILDVDIWTIEKTWYSLQ